MRYKLFVIFWPCGNGFSVSLSRGFDGRCIASVLNGLSYCLDCASLGYLTRVEVVDAFSIIIELMDYLLWITFKWITFRSLIW